MRLAKVQAIGQSIVQTIVPAMVLALAAPAAWAQQAPEGPAPTAPEVVAPESAAPPAALEGEAATALPSAGTEAPQRRLRLGVSLGYSRYAEDAMALAGPTVGLHGEWAQPLGLEHWTLQASGLASEPDYSSPVSGNLQHRKTRETAWRLLYSLPEPTPWDLKGRLQAGLELQTYYNDMRGTTSVGHQGYERERYGLWATAAYQAPVARDDGDAVLFGPQSWRVEAALLLQGVAVSHLSQVSSAYADAYNPQSRGFSLRAERSYRYALGAFAPYVLLSWVDTSEVVRQSTYSVVEPANTTWQLGMKWFWN